MPETTCRNSAPTAAKSSTTRLLVVGCGNPSASDDAAGIEIVRRLEAVGDNGCKFCHLPMSDLELLDLLREADVILVADAVWSGAAPGTLHLVTLPSLALDRRSVSALSSHGWGLRESLELARALGRRLPRMVLLGVEVASVEPGSGRSPAVERAIAAVVESFPRLREWLVSGAELRWPNPQDFFSEKSRSQGDLRCA